MANNEVTKPENHTDHPYENGAVGAIASVAAIGTALGAAIGIAAELPGLLVGAAIGGTAATVGGLLIAEEMGHPTPVKPNTKV
ncbi:MAG: hypothetical protein K2Q32_05805 [Alphaproteobacteria bacterium]|nr:hypothetical protein [Alphaproteobacteria bacterium]